MHGCKPLASDSTECGLVETARDNVTTVRSGPNGIRMPICKRDIFTVSPTLSTTYGTVSGSNQDPSRCFGNTHAGGSQVVERGHLIGNIVHT